MEKVRTLVKSGIFRDPGSFSFREIVKGKDGAVEKLVSGVSMLLKKDGVRVVKGLAELGADRVVRCGGEEYTGENVIIATGSEPVWIPIPGKELCIDSTEVLSLESLPESMTVIGGGVIGLEIACAFAAFGTEVTVVEMLPALMAREQKEAVRYLLMQIKKLGVNVKTDAKMLRVEADGAYKKAVYEFKGREESVRCEQVLMAVGRKPRLTGIDVKALGLETDRKGCVVTDDRQCTCVPGVYAIGDAAGGPQLAHEAYAEGEAALASILGKEFSRPKYVPACTYTIPCFASVGLTTEAAAEKGFEPVMGSFSYAANGMALAEDAGGFVYVVADKATTKTLGVTIVGEGASELIAFGAMAVERGLTPGEWESMIVAHPTLSEMVKEAALDAFGKAVHKA